MVSVLTLKCHPRIIFVSDDPPSAASLSFAIIGSQGMGSFLLFDQAATLIVSGFAASSSSMFLVSGRTTVIPVVSLM
jgi:hypothetical protein